ncbi:NAD(P)-binding protein [Meira miltonrushii]|uniref:NAD(P)-binding protein n=1 Tax=Meira miltonrushii TaxID=1280837 RepID=A0A316V2W2_9BASI|nr:NAD(P)-binding protein [Meira miltonrushii]PWN31338.1 NAD(P)-binding protein [Meira miltonrushii]
MSLNNVPQSCKAFQLERGAQKGERNQAILRSIEIPKEKEGMVLVQMTAAGFNRRDEWAMQGLYPGLTFGDSTIGCDGVGKVVRGKMEKDSRLPTHPNDLVILVPTRGWQKDPLGPEPALEKTKNGLGGNGFGLLGSTKPTNGVGTFIEYCQIEKDMVVNVPAHLNSLQAACLPCGGVTAFRALFTKAKIEKGQSILITGIGGGVAILALQFAVARGANVFVTGGTQEKVNRAIELGAKGGVLYREKDWPKRLAKMVKDEMVERPYLDAVIDSAGGEVPAQAAIAGLKNGGKIVCYGMTASPKMTITMREVLRNVDVMGSTMGSAEEFKEMIHFIDQNKIVPVIDTVLDGLQEAKSGFALLQDADKRSGGKVVIKIAQDTKERQSRM